MDLRTILDTKSVISDKPVIVAINASKPMVFKEFESQVDGIIMHFGVSGSA